MGGLARRDCSAARDLSHVSGGGVDRREFRRDGDGKRGDGDGAASECFFFFFLSFFRKVFGFTTSRGVHLDSIDAAGFGDTSFYLAPSDHRFQRW